MSTTPPPSGSSPANSALTLDAPHETTLAGHVSEHLDRVPQPGEPSNSTALASK
jgi:hypothetical protein